MAELKFSTEGRARGKVAVAQLTSTGDHAANFANVAALAEEASEQGCGFLALPECFSFIGTSAAETVAQSEGLDGPRMQQYKDLAKQHAMWISCGGFHERATPAAADGVAEAVAPDTPADGSVAMADKVYNSHVMIQPDGEIASVYRKIHLFDVK